MESKIFNMYLSQIQQRIFNPGFKIEQLKKNLFYIGYHDDMPEYIAMKAWLENECQWKYELKLDESMGNGNLIFEDLAGAMYFKLKWL